MAVTVIKFKRGNKTNLPNIAAPGEPLIALDTQELFIGDSQGNPKKISDIVVSNKEPENKTKLWWDTTDESLKRYDNEKWIFLSEQNLIQMQEEINKIISEIGDISNVNTTNKTNLVNAINEINTNLKKILDNNIIVTKKTYVHEQILPLKIWDIIHNLDEYPSVTIVNSNEVLTIGEISYISPNNINIVFSEETSGKAYLN